MELQTHCVSIMHFSPLWNPKTAVLLSNAVQSKIEHQKLCVTQYVVQLTMQLQDNRCSAQ